MDNTGKTTFNVALNFKSVSQRKRKRVLLTGVPGALVKEFKIIT
jgi:predicted tellurium resistance membrane protein TerC